MNPPSSKYKVKALFIIDKYNLLKCKMSAQTKHATLLSLLWMKHRSYFEAVSVKSSSPPWTVLSSERIPFVLKNICLCPSTVGIDVMYTWNQKYHKEKKRPMGLGHWVHGFYKRQRVVLECKISSKKRLTEGDALLSIKIMHTPSVSVNSNNDAWKDYIDSYLYRSH